MADTLTRADVQRIATLARLELTADEIALFADQLSAILAYADQVRQADTSNVRAGFAGSQDPASAQDPARDQDPANDTHPGYEDTTRADEPAPCLPRDAVLEQAPDADRRAGVFTVPRVLGS